MGDDAQVPVSGVFINRVSATAHMCHKTDPEKSACGVLMNTLSFTHDEGQHALIGAMLCWRSGCNNWVARIDEPNIVEPTSPAALSEGVETIELEVAPLT